MWVAGGSGSRVLAYSYDGINWNQANNGGISLGVYALAWNGSMWVAGGQSSSTTSALAYSYNGINWTAATNNGTNGGITTCVQCVAWNGSMWVAGGGQFTNPSIKYTLAYSYNGIFWYTIPFRVDQGTRAMSVAWNGRLWLLGGRAGSTSYLAYSYNGIDWTNITTVNATIILEAKTVAWNGSLWVGGGKTNAAVAPATFIKSSDGITWTTVTPTGGITTQVNSVAWNGSLWVAGGLGSGQFAYSYDGTNWTASPNNGGITTQVNAVASRRVLPNLGTSPIIGLLPSITNASTLGFVDTQSLTSISSLYNSNGSLYFGANKVHINPVTFSGSNTISTTNVMAYNQITSNIYCTDSIIISSVFTSFGVFSNGTYLTSDSNIKENISSADLLISYSNIKQLPLRRFTYIPSYSSSKVDKTQLGFIAQEVYNLYPKSIYSTFDQVLHLNFDQIFLSHYGATQQLISTVEQQEFSLLQQESTIQGQDSEVLSLTNSYSTLISQFNTFLLDRSF
jgi:hypothetical protein